MVDRHADTTESNPRLRARLLPPERDPSALLWPRIVAARQRQVRRRRGIGAALSALAAIVLAWVVLPHSLAPVQRDAAHDWQARAQLLEQRWHEQGAGSSAASQVQALQADLQALDQRLQSAYDRGADAAELMPLWQRRCDLLNTLLMASQPALQLTRI